MPKTFNLPPENETICPKRFIPDANWPEIHIIAAIARNGVIGAGGRLPWCVPGELAHFKRVTNGHPLLMGRLTWESLPLRPLPERRNIVLSRRMREADGADVFGSLDAALRAVGAGRKVFVIGGAEVFAQALPLASHAYLSHIDLAPEGDVFFPPYDDADWDEVESCDLAQSSPLQNDNGGVAVTLLRFSRRCPHGPQERS